MGGLRVGNQQGGGVYTAGRVPRVASASNPGSPNCINEWCVQPRSRTYHELPVCTINSALAGA